MEKTFYNLARLEISVQNLTINKNSKIINSSVLRTINSHETDSIGSSLSITMEWSRPIVVETESLTNYTKFGYPKRSTRWINSSKLDLIVAVLGKYTKIKLENMTRHYIYGWSYKGPRLIFPFHNAKSGNSATVFPASPVWSRS